MMVTVLFLLPLFLLCFLISSIFSSYSPSILLHHPPINFYLLSWLFFLLLLLSSPLPHDSFFPLSPCFCLYVSMPGYSVLNGTVKTLKTYHHSAAPTLATHAANGSYPVHLVSEAATPRRGSPFLDSGFVPPGCGWVVKETSPHPSGPGVHA